MLNGRYIIYIYDGSFYGLMSAIFDCYYNHEYPFDIRTDENMQTELFCEYFYSVTDNSKAERVINSVINKISSAALYHIYCTFLSDSDEKEMMIFDFLIEGYKYGASVIDRMTSDRVFRLIDTAKRTSGEAHLYKGFVRFKKLKNGVFFSEIEPKGRVLPLILNHFCSRFSTLPFVICDLTHKECIVYNGKTAEIKEFFSVPELQYADDEERFSDMWKDFYNTIEIKERHNEKCRMGMLPKRYWRCMTEFN